MEQLATITVTIPRVSARRRLWLALHCMYCSAFVIRNERHLNDVHPVSGGAR